MPPYRFSVAWAVPRFAASLFQGEVKAGEERFYCPAGVMVTCLAASASLPPSRMTRLKDTFAVKFVLANGLAWPKTMAERLMAVSGALTGVTEAVTAADVANGFSRAKAADVGEILETLCAVGRAHKGKVEETFLP